MISIKPVVLVLAVFVFGQETDGRNYLSPPSPVDEAKMARYVVNNADWTAVGTISTQENITGFPFVGLKSTSDGPVNNGRGIPYMMMTDMDVSMQDINALNKCTLFFSLAQTEYCKSQNYDPQDPRCARIMLTGSVEKVVNDSEEFKFAKSTLIARHPAMRNWPTDHGFFVAKLNIVQVAVLDFFGGIKYVTPEDYLNADINEDSEYRKNLDERMNFIDNDIQVKLVRW